MAFVLDCSVAIAWVFPDEDSDATGRLRDSPIEDRAFVPTLWPGEVGGVLFAAARRIRIGVDNWPRICAILGALPVEVEPVSVTRVWLSTLDVARRHDLSIYDATCLDLAPRMKLPFATLDRALAKAARHAGIETPATPRL